MNILTFDLEEWFHYDMISGNGEWENYEVRIDRDTDRVLALLADHDTKATFFCLGWVASRHPGIIRQIVEAGHEVGCHSYLHEPAFKMNRDQFTSDTERAVKSIEDITGKKINLYRAPAFSITASNTWAFEVLAQLGIEIDCSILPASHDYGGFPSFGNTGPVQIEYKGHRMKEFPINTTRFAGRDLVFSGGGFFRIMPYLFIRSRMKRSIYVMTYFHPRDFDPQLPVLKHLPLRRQIKSRAGLKGAYRKLDRMLRDFDFMNVEQANRVMDWDRVKTIRLD